MPATDELLSAGRGPRMADGPEPDPRRPLRGGQSLSKDGAGG